MDDDLFPSLDKNKDFIINNNHILEKLTGKKRKRRAHLSGVMRAEHVSL
jgi:uncharacterized protein YaaN involved in tellurite resistance